MDWFKLLSSVIIVADAVSKPFIKSEEAKKVRDAAFHVTSTVVTGLANQVPPIPNK